MRTPTFIVLAALAFTAGAQSAQPRFIEVLVTDTVHLPFTGMDYEVRMPSALDMAGSAELGDDPSEKAIDKALNEMDAQAKGTEAKFKAAMDAGGFTYRLASTENAEDYQFGTSRTFEVNTYHVELSKQADFERFNAFTEGEQGVTTTPGDMRYGPAAAEAPRMMRKLYEQAHLKAQALVSVTGGKLGVVISAQEVKRDEGSFLEQLFKMDKMGGNDEETMRMLSSTYTTSMAFRFALTD